jgi:hypothetical protein
MQEISTNRETSFERNSRGNSRQSENTDEGPERPQPPRENSHPSENGDEGLEQPQPPRRRTIWSKAKIISMPLSFWIFTAIFIILYSFYVYRALLSPNPQVGSLLLSASNTNVLVSVLSQVCAKLV